MKSIIVSTAGRQISVKPNATMPSTPGAANSAQTASQAPVIVVKRGDPITIVLQDGALTVTYLSSGGDPTPEGASRPEPSIAD